MTAGGRGRGRARERGRGRKLTAGTPVRARTVVTAAVITMAMAVATLALGAQPAGGGKPDTFNEQYLSLSTQVQGSYVPIIGDFDCDGSIFEIIWYAPGPAPDYYWKITGKAGGEALHTSEPLTINGTYEPLIVFYDDAGGCAYDIFWYAPGPAPDYIWDVDTPGDFGYTSVHQPVNGHYTPIFTELGPGDVNGIYWYRPGTATDHAWVLDGDGTIDTGGGLPPQVNGTYQPVAAQGSSGELGILWYAPGTAQDWFWREFEPGDASPGVNVPVSINGTYEAYPIIHQVLLYGPGGAPDFVVHDINENTGKLVTIPGNVSGDYTVATSLTRNGIVWHRPGSATDHIWLRD